VTGSRASPPPDARSTCSTPGGARGSAAATAGGLLLHSLLFAQHAAELTTQAARLASTAGRGAGRGAAVPCACLPGVACDHSDDKGEDPVQHAAVSNGLRAGSIPETLYMIHELRRSGSNEHRQPQQPQQEREAASDSGYSSDVTRGGSGVCGGYSAVAVGYLGDQPAPASAMHQRLMRVRDIRRSSSDCAERIARLAAVRGRMGGPLPAPARAPPQRRFSISRAKSILAECAVGAADRGAFVACETGVLSPLLARIRADGAPVINSGLDSMDSGDSCGGNLMRRTSTELWPASSRGTAAAAAAAAAAGDGSSGSRRPSSEGFGGVPPRPATPNQPLAPLSTSSSTSGGSRPRRSQDEDGAGARCPCPCPPGQRELTLELQRLQQQEADDDRQAALHAQQQRLLDCLETVSYLAVDDTNRSALINLGALSLLAGKFAAAVTESASAQRGPAGGKPNGTSTSTRMLASPATGAAALRAVVGLARSDSAKREFWAGPGGSALLSLLSRASSINELVAAGLSSVESLGWSAGLDSAQHTGGSGLFGGGGGAGYLSSSIYSGGGRNGSGSFTSGSGSFTSSGALNSGTSMSGSFGKATSSSGAPRLLEPRLITALGTARALHPHNDPALAMSALQLLLLAQQRQAERERQSAPAGGGSVPPLIAAQHEAELQAAWRGAAFALVPLLVAASQRVVQQQAHRLVASTDRPEPHHQRTQYQGAQHEGLAGGSRQERQQQSAVSAALDLAGSLSESPDAAAALCAAGALPPMVALLLDGSGSGGGSGGSTQERVASTLTTLARRGGRCAVHALREECTLAGLLRALAVRNQPLATKSALLMVLVHAAVAGETAGGEPSRAGAVQLLRARGALQTVRLLLSDSTARGGGGEVERRCRDLLAALSEPNRASGRTSGAGPAGADGAAAAQAHAKRSSAESALPRAR